MRGARSFVPWLGQVSGGFVAVLYTAFGLTDMVLSLAAFAGGVPEANPLMAWLFARDLFVPAKVLLTGIGSLLIAGLYAQRRVRVVAWGALLLTAAVNVYHLWGLSLIS